VIFQYLPALVAVLLLPALVIGGAGLALDRSQVVETKVWAERPIFTPQFSPQQFAPGENPADTEAATFQEMIGTDTYMGQVLARVEPDYAGWSESHKASAAALTARNLSVRSAGGHLFLVDFRTEQPEYGKRLLTAVVDVFGKTLVQLQSAQVGSVQSSFQAQLDGARQQVDQAVAQAESYRQAHHIDFQAAANDPNYNSLQAQAKVKLDQYLTLAAQADAAAASEQAVPAIQAALLRVVDQPAVAPKTLSSSTPALRAAMIVLAASAVAAVLFVYVVARRDPRVRCLEDVRRDVGSGLRLLGTAPAVR
jgi:hypothetical protein